ncbi:hypothetical protein F511_21608 [Dorcoceras hygrometricum]|uniref:Uncharacterized protein n=1 Tax=Dorcoceras hygrometricum TaxID=472368 RepID=A0A2Z7AVJ8_9LAMI|nr:hypothetical protein F511_21608 [Dorcoceras hygrometricum]
MARLFLLALILFTAIHVEGAPPLQNKNVRCRENRLYPECSRREDLFCPDTCPRDCAVECRSCVPVCVPPVVRCRNGPKRCRNLLCPASCPETCVANCDTCQVACPPPPPPVVITPSPPPPPPPPIVITPSPPPPPPITTPIPPPPDSSEAAGGKRVRCKSKLFPDCKEEHRCPAACPDRCEVNCVTCSPVCECNMPGAVCQDPRFIGADGLTFYFHGKKDSDFCIISDTNLHINAHFIGRRNIEMGRDFTWVQSLGILFQNHRIYVGAKKTATWDNAKDRLDLSFDGQPVYIPQGEGQKWQVNSATGLKVTRTRTTNAVEIELEGNFRIKTTVVPITKQESQIHKYNITGDDCFAHLDLGFKFYSLSGDVTGVLGQTYATNYVSRVKMGVDMPVLGGDKEFGSSSLFSTDCAAARFNISRPWRDYNSEPRNGNSDPIDLRRDVDQRPAPAFRTVLLSTFSRLLLVHSCPLLRCSAAAVLSPLRLSLLIRREFQAVLAFCVLAAVKVLLVAMSLIMDYHLALWYTLGFLVIYIIAQQPAYEGPGTSNQLTPLQLETLLTEGNASRFWLKLLCRHFELDKLLLDYVNGK